VGYDSEAYPQPSELGDYDSLLAAITKQIPNLKKSIARRLAAEKLIDFGFHVICVPFPSIEDFRSKLLVQLGLK
jgi:Cap4 SAVED domain